jgi:hypothetical protein
LDGVKTQYAYLLGLYLGDGWMRTFARGYQFVLTLGSCYPGIIAEAAAAMQAVMPQCTPRIRPRVSRCVDVSAYGVLWPTLLPQHGPGRKHERKIQLVDWQRQITDQAPRALLRGLIHSDGCRCMATIRRRGRTYRYSRYYFDNRSDDIRSIFCEHLDMLGIGWTRSSRFTIQIARRDAVAALDEFVGPKQ